VSAINAGATVIDVREPQEFSDGAIAGAINVPLGRIQQQGLAALRNAGVDTDAATLLLVCRSGARSGSACLSLRAALGDRAKNLAGGVMAWGSRGLPLTPGGRPQR
jgi:rhodanese-related sulfurtransferase